MSISETFLFSSGFPKSSCKTQTTFSPSTFHLRKHVDHQQLIQQLPIYIHKHERSLQAPTLLKQQRILGEPPLLLKHRSTSRLHHPRSHHPLRVFMGNRSRGPTPREFPHWRTSHTCARNGPLLLPKPFCLNRGVHLSW